jgi:hypothetical protein
MAHLYIDLSREPLVINQFDVEEIKKEGGKCSFRLYKINDEIINKVNEIISNVLTPECADKTRVSVFYNGDKEQNKFGLMKNNEIAALAKIDKKLLTDFHTELYIESIPIRGAGYADEGKNDWSFGETLYANRHLNEIIEIINTHKINGHSMSPYEKYLAAYNWVTTFVYNPAAEHGESMTQSRHPIGVLTSDKIVCAGFANLLAHVCENVGIKCKSTGVLLDEEPTNYHMQNHSVNVFILDDKKYNLSGTFMSDPTNDAGLNSFALSAIPISKIKDCNMRFENLKLDNKFKNENFTEISELAFRSALSVAIDVPLPNKTTTANNIGEILNQTKLGRKYLYKQPAPNFGMER